MDTGLLLGLAALDGLLVVLLCALLAAAVATRRSSRSALAAVRLDLDVLRGRIEQLQQQGPSTPEPAPAGEPGYLITDAGRVGDAATTSTASTSRGDEAAAGERAIVSATLGEPLVKVVAFGYAVRRALSAPSRNRIAFEMRREVRRSRKQRRRVVKQALREERSGQRAALVGGDPA